MSANQCPLIVHLMIQGDGVYVAAKRVICIKTRPDFDVFFQLLNNLCADDNGASG